MHADYIRLYRLDLPWQGYKALTTEGGFRTFQQRMEDDEVSKSLQKGAVSRYNVVPNFGRPIMEFDKGAGD